MASALPSCCMGYIWAQSIHIRTSPHFKYMSYLEGWGDLVSRFIMGIIRVSVRVVRPINLLTTSP